MLIRVRVIPNARSTEIVSRIGSVLRISIPYGRYDGKTNTLLRKFLANFFEVSYRNVIVRKGQNGKEKTIEIEGKPEHQLKQILETIP